MKKLLAIAALTFCCTATYAQTNPIIVQSPDGRIVQCISSGGIIRCY